MFENKILLLKKEKYCCEEKNSGHKKTLYVAYSLNTKTMSFNARIITTDYDLPRCEMLCDSKFELWLKDFLKHERLELYYSCEYFEDYGYVK